MHIEAIVIGVSAGGFKTLDKLIMGLREDIQVPIIVVQHIGASSENYIVTYLNDKSPLNIKEVEEKEWIIGGTVYFAPSNYHVLIERNKTFSLTVEEKVSFARPSIDVLFESAAEAYPDQLLGLVLTGANSDGTNGCRAIKACGGLVFVQNPDEAEFMDMPLSVIRNHYQDAVMTIDEMIDVINKIR